MMKVKGNAWISGEDSDGYWAEGVKCNVEVEVTDMDEIRVGLVLIGDETEAAGVYLTRKTADDLARLLAAASVMPLKITA